jgi:diguanylate cyclase (GGDEF)-like protein/putative nucleotidyltransferase with HDIG domain
VPTLIDVGGYVHHCVFCGWSRPADGATILDPACAHCGCTLGADTADDYARLSPVTRRRIRVAPAANADVTGIFALVASLPFLLPLAGIKLGDVAFLLPLVLLTFAAVATLRAGRVAPARRTLWIGVATSVALAIGASALGLAHAIAGGGELGAFYVGSLSSVAALAAIGSFAVPTLRAARVTAVIDGLIVAVTVGALGAVFVVVPGLRDGDALLTAVAGIDLITLLLGTLAAIVRRSPADRRVLVPLLAGWAAATLGDCLVSASAAGQMGVPTGLTPVLWAVAGYAIAVAADSERPADAAPAAKPARPEGDRWIYARTLLPLTLIVGTQALGVGLWLTDRLETWGAIVFGAVLVAQVGLAFWRQAQLLVENRRAVARERAAREEAQRHNEELEALTGLATTMTQTLEEAPIAEQALSVLHLAARATSSALHMRSEAGVYELRATAGDWLTEKTWAGTLTDDSRPQDTRGGRAIVRMQVAARGSLIGTVTLVRRAEDAFEPRALELLGLLVDQMAVALQNARDYRDRLEEAIRDPLTGLYNRRFLVEALDKEVVRSERYGNDVSLVIFDVDDFKSVNDDHGHATGDDVLRAIGQIAESVIRPLDSFARVGGEEFALLLPQTAQLDALLIAERVRTAISRREILPDRRVTVSGGVASCPHDATERDELHRRADAALYWAKRNGKDLCAVASEVADSAANSGEHDGMLAHLYALVAGIDAQHLHTRDHSENVAAYAVALGQALGLERERVVRLRRAALLHDVGKVAIPRAILEKPSRLTPDEFEHMKLHAHVGAAMLAHAGLREEATWVRHHHERVDGGGYPDGVAGDAIPIEARIIFVADSFEAMTSDRPYRAGMPVADAVAELRRCAGKQFQPEIVETIAKLLDDGALTVLCLRQDEVGPRAASRR